MNTLWKAMLAGPRSASGNLGAWKIGEWLKHNGQISLCNQGFHASEQVIHAMGYVNAEVIAEVEVRGDNLKESDKQVWSEMRIIKAWSWEKEDSVALAIYAAELVLKIFEDKYPNDKRPRQAIEAAKEWIKNPSEKNRAAARAAAGTAAAAAWAARAAAAAAEAAAAAWAAWAARATAAAAWAAWAAAGTAAGTEIIDKCSMFVIQRLELKQSIKQ